MLITQLISSVNTMDATLDNSTIMKDYEALFYNNVAYLL